MGRRELYGGEVSTTGTGAALPLLAETEEEAKRRASWTCTEHNEIPPAKSCSRSVSLRRKTRKGQGLTNTGLKLPAVGGTSSETSQNMSRLAVVED